MGDIRYFSDLGLTTDRNLERIVAAAKADQGLWLMIKEREMEFRAHKALARRGEGEHAFQSELNPSLSDLARTLVNKIFGNCPSQMIAIVEARLLGAAKSELDTNFSSDGGCTEARDGKPD